jgi:hypothetical protein
MCQHIFDRMKKCRSIGKFISPQELLDITEKIKVRWSQILWIWRIPSAFQCIALYKIQHNLCRLRTRVISVPNALSIRPSDLSSAWNWEWINNVSDSVN